MAIFQSGGTTSYPTDVKHARLTAHSHTASLSIPWKPGSLLYCYNLFCCRIISAREKKLPFLKRRAHPEGRQSLIYLAYGDIWERNLTLSRWHPLPHSAVVDSFCPPAPHDANLFSSPSPEGSLTAEERRNAGQHCTQRR